jgi:hypothetical protein
MALGDTEKLLEFYSRSLVDAWNKNHPDYQWPLVFEECEVDPEDRACEVIAMPKLVNHMLDQVVTTMKMKTPNTIGALRFQLEFIQIIDQMRPKATD